MSPPTTTRPIQRSLLYRTGLGSARHPWRTIAAWLVAAVVVLVASGVVGGSPQDDYTIPGVDSQVANDLLTERFPDQSGATARIVVHRPEGITSERLTIASMIGRVAALPHVVAVSDPFDPAAPSVDADGTTAVIGVAYDAPVTDVAPDDALAGLEEAARVAEREGIQVEFGGEVPENATPPSSNSEMIGLLVAAVVLFVAFGSLLAMGLPILVAVASLLVGMGGIMLLSAAMDVSTITPMIAAMVGLGVGIDYALFVLTRHRERLVAGDDVRTAAATATATAGKAVVFAGGTVVVAICGLWFVDVPILASIGFGAAIVVAVSVAAAVTLLPALLALSGDRLRTTRHEKRLERRGRATGRAPMAARWADHVGRHPVRYASAGLVVLLLLAAPVLGLRLGWADAGNEPTSTTQRRAYDLTAEEFGPGANGPIIVAVDLTGVDGDQAADDAVLDHLSDELGNTEDVAMVLPPEINAAGATAVVTVVPTTGPESPRTSELVDRLRDDTLPAATEASGASAHVTGPTAVLVDLTQRLSGRLLVFIGAVVLMSFLLLVALFHSLVVPLKAAIMNLLSIGAAYGVLVAVFQWGWGARLLGLDGPVPVTAFVPVMVFAIVFGLSMDYEVFLLSRIREEYDRTGDPHRSVVDGLSATARVITCAALVMISVFLAFAMSPSVTVKMMGIGLATAVLVDATIIRLVLVPSSMAILGRSNWWLPSWLDRILPTVTLEHPDEALDTEASDPDDRPVPADIHGEPSTTAPTLVATGATGATGGSVANGTEGRWDR